MNKPPDVLRIYLTFAIATFGIAAVLVAFLVAVSMFGSSGAPQVGQDGSKRPASRSAAERGAGATMPCPAHA